MFLDIIKELVFVDNPATDYRGGLVGSELKATARSDSMQPRYTAEPPPEKQLCLNGERLLAELPPPHGPFWFCVLSLGQAWNAPQVTIFGCRRRGVLD